MRRGDAHDYSVSAPETPIDIAPNQPFRGDIQGLRAIAVLVVALNHAGVTQLSGGYVGVDVFFVISGFLITGLLLRRSARDRKVGFGEFYAARARRILPIATFTLIATTVASWYFLNFIRAQSAFRDSIWATFFAANVRFSRIGTDYFASAEPKSPIQHFWSLAVEEQFYLLFPLIVMASLFVFRKDALFHYDDNGHRRRGRFARQDVDRAAIRRLTLALTILVITSLAWSVYETSQNPAAAYFSALTRGWELGVGALVAVGATLLARIPAVARAMLSWLGLAIIFASVVVMNESTAFPGYLAAIPVAGAALVIIGGLGEGHPLGAKLILSAQPLRFIGDVSYSFYMWHWPILIIATQRAGERLSVTDGLRLLTLAFAISVVTYFVIEQPLHRGKLLSGTRRGLTVWPIAISTVLVAAIVGLQAVQREIDRRTVPVAIASTTTTRGNTSGTTVPADTTNTPSTLPVTGPTSPYEQAVEASTTSERLGTPIPLKLNPPVQSLADGLYDPKSCSPGFGATTSSDICHLGDPDATRKLVLFGDSHARMWVTPIADYAKTNNWDLIPLFKEGCVASNIGSGDDKNRPACEAWQRWAFDQVEQLQPDAVVIAHSYSESARFGDEIQAGSVATVQREVAAISKHAERVVILGDIPFLDRNPIDCLLANNAKFGDCVTEISSSLDYLENAMQQTATDNSARFVSTRPWFCAGTSCPTVIGDVIAYRDKSHVSPVYAALLTPALTDVFNSVLQ